MSTDDVLLSTTPDSYSSLYTSTIGSDTTHSSRDMFKDLQSTISNIDDDNKSLSHLMTFIVHQFNLDDGISWYFKDHHLVGTK